MSGALPTHLRVAALLRRVNDSGGIAVVRARGDAQAGGVLLLLDEAIGGGFGGEGRGVRAVERGLGLDGRTALIESLAPGGDAEGYWRRRRSRDPDLWVIELTIPAAERFAAETLLVD